MTLLPALQVVCVSTSKDQQTIPESGESTRSMREVLTPCKVSQSLRAGVSINLTYANGAYLSTGSESQVSPTGWQC